jgi:hypothetical protein
MTESWNLREQREYAWNYFELHAKQRMAVFNFFVLIAALLTAGLAGSLNRDDGCRFVSFALALSLIVTSFVFWRLDQRVRCLIKRAEGALKMLEKHRTNEVTNTSDHLDLFSAEEAATDESKRQLREKHPFCYWAWPITYNKCFRFVYIVFGVIGILGIIMSIAAHGGWTMK